MLSKDAVSARLNSEHGISYTEFSYQILQGYDYLELYRRYNCMLQMGGSDQWGNLTSGTDLIRKAEGVSAHILATPLITNSDGKKFGKSEGNAVWLDADLTSPYAFYQFWLNVEDADVIDRLKVFTFLTRAEIEELEKQTAEAPYLRAAQKRLALEVTTLVHSLKAAESAIAASAALFGQGEIADLDSQTLASAIAELPNATVVTGTALTQILVETSLVDSISAARRAIKEGGVYLNNQKVEDESAEITDFIHGQFAILRRGKKTLAGIIKA
jgi:tyrosyl-tRNA synthetase